MACESAFKVFHKLLQEHRGHLRRKPSAVNVRLTLYSQRNLQWDIEGKSKLVGETYRQRLSHPLDLSCEVNIARGTSAELVLVLICGVEF